MSIAWASYFVEDKVCDSPPNRLIFNDCVNKRMIASKKFILEWILCKIKKPDYDPNFPTNSWLTGFLFLSGGESIPKCNK